MKTARPLPPERPGIEFFLADGGHPVAPGDGCWQRDLPLTRGAESGAAAPIALTYGDYFAAVAQFLARENWQAVRCAMGESADAGTPLRLAIFLEKHGAFYHPSRVLIETATRSCERVVNVAVSSAGQALLPREVDLLRRLETRFGHGRLPAVYASQTVALADGRALPMFLGQWFSEFFEFHLTAGADSGGDLVAWAAEGPRRLDPRQVRDVYRQAAALLTDYYDVFSGEQILDWHHAAGDFILRPLNDGRVDLRLVTVRRYAPLLKDAASGLETVLLSVALFIAHTTLGLRLDRCNGVGDLVLAGLDAVDGAVEGIFQALARKVVQGVMPAELFAAIAAHLGAQAPADLAVLIAAVNGRRPAGDPMRVLMAGAAAAHADRLHQALTAAAPGDLSHYIQR